MDKNIENAIKDLYAVFSKYPVNLEIDGCPCCVHNEHKTLLLSKPLKELGEKELSRYTSKAMTTWGRIEDYKYYLPRIFELSIKDNLGVGEHIVFGKLDYANWLGWSKDEIDALKEFFNIWWEYNLKGNDYLNTEVMIELLKKLDYNEELIEKWSLSDNNRSLENFIEFISDGEFNGILEGKSFYENLNLNFRLALHQWIENGIVYLRTYQSKNEKFTRAIKDALYVYEDGHLEK